MTQQPDPADAPPALPALKVEEQDHDPKKPWADDVLDRKEIADRLTSIVRGQEAPFVISLDGRWGTGKTFLLKRWAQDLENDGWQAIYYNAWEDDYADDPLLAITAQLTEHVGEEKFAEKARSLLGRLVRPTYFATSVASAATVGMPLPALPAGNQAAPDHLGGYHQRRAAKDELKQSLIELAAKVREDTGQPLIFIIDELDRCRPTFAIELLERVKHIFDVPNIVFVFGINRGELVKSLESVYGEIDSGTYLRRFFDMEFTLPEPDPVEFCKSLAERYGLRPSLYHWGAATGSSLRPRVGLLASALPVLAGHMGLSLRDMDYCVRVVSLAVANDDGRSNVDQHLLAGLVALKVSNPRLYHRYMEGSARGAEVIDYFNGLTRANRRQFRNHLMYDDEGLERIEAAIYCADDGGQVMSQFQRMASNSAPDRPEYLSREHQRLNIEDPERLEKIIQLMDEDTRSHSLFGMDRDRLAELIDLYTDFTRR